MKHGFPKAITTTKLDRGHYRIDREDGYSIEVRRRSKREWYQISNMATRKTLALFETDMKNGAMVEDAVIEKPKATKVSKKSANYKGHRSERTADLHRAYDEMDRKAALKYAVHELTYTEAGAASWFSYWDKEVVLESV